MRQNISYKLVVTFGMHNVDTREEIGQTSSPSKLPFTQVWL